MYDKKHRHRRNKDPRNLDRIGKPIQIGSTVRIGEPGRFDDHKAPFSGKVVEIMEERNTVLVAGEAGGEFVVEFGNVSLLARADESEDAVVEEPEELAPATTGEVT